MYGSRRRDPIMPQQRRTPISCVPVLLALSCATPFLVTLVLLQWRTQDAAVHTRQRWLRHCFCYCCENVLAHAMLTTGEADDVIEHGERAYWMTGRVDSGHAQRVVNDAMQLILPLIGKDNPIIMVGFSGGHPKGGVPELPRTS